MILLTKIDGQHIVINAEEIESIEIGINSIICLKSGKKYIVQETHEQITEMVIDYKRKCNQTPLQIENKTE